MTTLRTYPRRLSIMQEQILTFILEYERGHDCAPKHLEIAHYCNISGPGVAYHLRILEARGYIKRTWKRPRNIRVVRPPERMRA